MPYRNPAKQARYQYARQKRLRREWIAANGGACALCGSKRHLEIDHINPADKTSNNIWSWSATRRAAELLKCRVLCRLCNRRRGAQYRWDKYRALAAAHLSPAESQYWTG